MRMLIGWIVGSRFRVRALCAPIAATLLFLCAPASAGARDSRTVVVVLDRDTYQSHETTLLEDDVFEAAQSRSDRIGVSGSDDGHGITVTIRDLSRDALFPEIVEKQFAAKPGYSVTRTPATTIRISYSASAQGHFSPKALARDADGLVEYVNMLRPVSPGITIEAQLDGAIIRSNDPSTVNVITRALGAGFVIAQMSATSWHVAFKEDALPGVTPARKLEYIGATELALRQLLGDPHEVQAQKTGDGVEVTIADSELNSGFVENIRHTFSKNPDFAVAESPCLIMHVALPNSDSQSVLGLKSAALPPLPNFGDPFFTAMDALDALANPPVRIIVTGNSVLVSARDPSHNADRAAFVRQALATRSDLVIDTKPDQSLRISLAPGAHLGPPIPALQPGQLVDVVKARAIKLGIQAANVSALDTDRVRVTFHSTSAAESFRIGLLKPNGLTIRMVDESQTESPTAPPSHGDERLSGPNGETMWVRPDAIITSEMFADARGGVSKQTDLPDIEFRLTDEGRELFAAATRRFVGRRFAIVLDGKVISAPVIQTPILDGTGIVTGDFTRESANALADAITSHGNGLPLKVTNE